MTTFANLSNAAMVSDVCCAIVLSDLKYTIAPMKIARMNHRKIWLLCVGNVTEKLLILYAGDAINPRRFQ